MSRIDAFITSVLNSPNQIDNWYKLDTMGRNKPKSTVLDEYFRCYTRTTIFSELTDEMNLFSKKVLFSSQKTGEFEVNDNLRNPHKTKVSKQHHSSKTRAVSNPTFGNPDGDTDTDPVGGGGGGAVPIVGEVSEATVDTSVSVATKDTGVSVATKDTMVLPVFADFKKFNSLNSIEPTKGSITIAYDTEWMVDPSDGLRYVTSWQFSVIYFGRLQEFVILPITRDKNVMTLEIALGFICSYVNLGKSVDTRNTRKYKCLVYDRDTNGVIKSVNGIQATKELTFDTLKDADKTSEVAYTKKNSNLCKGNKVLRYNDWSKQPHLSITLVCHFGLVDISTMNQKGYYDVEFLPKCIQVGGGLLSLKPIKIYPMNFNPHNIEHEKCYNDEEPIDPIEPTLKEPSNVRRIPISLIIRDSMSFAPEGAKSLAHLGEVVGVPKISIEQTDYDAMEYLFIRNPLLYLNYSSIDTVVTLLYFSSINGYNFKSKPTITALSATVCKALQTEYLTKKVSSFSNYDNDCRGLKTMDKGLKQSDDGLGYLAVSTLEPLSLAVDTIQRFCGHAFGGGYNICSEVGYYSNKTFDHDMKNCYPTAMCLIPDIDWHEPIQSEITNKKLELTDFVIPVVGGVNPIPLFVGYITFTFPNTVRYPNIGINVDGIPVYPLSSQGVPGVYVSGVEIVLALQLGATIHCEKGYFLKPLLTEEHKISYSMQHVMSTLIKDRMIAQELFGKKSLMEQLFKLFANGTYGKLAQNVKPKDTWSAVYNDMVNIGCSAVTNPFAAMMTTAIIRSTLIATMNEVEKLGFSVYSATTDGFLSDIELDTLNKIDIGSLGQLMSQIRGLLTEGSDSTLWETKHSQNDLYNATTRGNFSCEDNGVCARNSAKSPHHRQARGIDSPEQKESAILDRLWLYKEVVSRTGGVPVNELKFPSLKDLISGAEFVMSTSERKVRMDFDMKRKPTVSSFKVVDCPCDGELYEVLNFKTEPHENLESFRLYRKKKANVDCLRTNAEWQNFVNIKLTNSKTTKVTDVEWAKIRDVVIGHRAGFWSIPKLTELQGQEKWDWINTFNKSTKTKYNGNHWKNAGKKERQTLAYTQADLQTLITTMSI